MVQLQRFVTSVIEAMGGLVEPVEYALVQAMAPAGSVDLFQGREEVLLAFDYEVAEENPQAEFVTFGSYLLDQLLSFVQAEALGAVRIADVEPPELAKAEEKIRKFLGPDAGSVVLKQQRTVYGMWAQFAFRLNYLSDEKDTEFVRIWVDLVQGTVCSDMQEHFHLIPLSDTVDICYPKADTSGIDTAFGLAHDKARELAERGKSGRRNDRMLERERIRIVDYYDELYRETLKRSERKGLTEEKKRELLDKAASIMQEKDKQLLDIADKYDVRTECLLDHGQLLLLPLLEYEVEWVRRREKFEATVHYNPIFKKWTMRSRTGL